MDEWAVEFTNEVHEWLDALPPTPRARAAAAIDLLSRFGPLLGEPHTRQLEGKLRELRFRLDRRQIRITYFLTPQRSIALLTVFEKRSPREPREIARAERVMAQWIAETDR